MTSLQGFVLGFITNALSYTISSIFVSRGYEKHIRHLNMELEAMMFSLKQLLDEQDNKKEKS